MKKGIKNFKRGRFAALAGGVLLVAGTAVNIAGPMVGSAHAAAPTYVTDAETTGGWFFDGTTFSRSLNAEGLAVSTIGSTVGNKITGLWGYSESQPLMPLSALANNNFGFDYTQVSGMAPTEQFIFTKSDGSTWGGTLNYESVYNGVLWATGSNLNTGRSDCSGEGSSVCGTIDELIANNPGVNIMAIGYGLGSGSAVNNGSFLIKNIKAGDITLQFADNQAPTITPTVASHIKAGDKVTLYYSDDYSGVKKAIAHFTDSEGNRCYTADRQLSSLGNVLAGSKEIDVTATCSNLVDGQVTLKYSATDAAGNSSKVESIAFILDTHAPTVTLDGARVQYIEQDVDTYTEQGAEFSDAIDGNYHIAGPNLIHYYTQDAQGNWVLQGSVQNVDSTKAGMYKLGYATADQAGNISNHATRVVYVRDTTAPLLYLNGDKTINIQYGANYLDAGAYATDAVDGTVNLTPVRIDYRNDRGAFMGDVQSVDTTKPGQYKIVYEYTDQAGNVGVDASRATHQYVMRIVTVADPIAPTPILPTPITPAAVTAPATGAAMATKTTGATSTSDNFAAVLAPIATMAALAGAAGFVGRRSAKNARE
jgi:hypothetical protein